MRALSNSKIKNQKSNPTVLVIGGAGYLGSVLCAKLLKQGYKVKVLDNLLYGGRGIKELIKNKNFTFLRGDIRSTSDVVGSLRGVDAVMHLAAIVGDLSGDENPEETLEINYLATKNIIEACKYAKINRFIFASTCSVYGKNSLPYKQLTENSKINPLSLYAITKMKCEEALLNSKAKNFSPTILRMATLYGYSPLMRFDLVANLFVAKAFFEKKITIFNGQQWRPWISVDDTADVYIKCLKAPLSKVGGEIFNALSENYKIIEVGKMVRNMCPGSEIEIIKKNMDEKDYNISNKKILKVLPFRASNMKNALLGVKSTMDRGIVKNYKDKKYRTVSA